MQLPNSGAPATRQARTNRLRTFISFHLRRLGTVPGDWDEYEVLDWEGRRYGGVRWRAGGGWLCTLKGPSGTDVTATGRTPKTALTACLRAVEEQVLAQPPPLEPPAQIGLPETDGIVVRTEAP